MSSPPRGMGFWLVFVLLFTSGCWDASSKPANKKQDGIDKYDHKHYGLGTHGIHGGVLQYADEYSFEAIYDKKNGNMIVYILSWNGETPIPIPAKPWILEIRADQEEEFVPVEMRAIPLHDDPPGLSSRFTGSDAILIKKYKVFYLYLRHVIEDKPRRAMFQILRDGEQKVVYLCPMDCEKGKAYTESGICPVCKMDLVAKGLVFYVCPMNCEKNKVYKELGACPVCKMDLVEQKIVYVCPMDCEKGEVYRDKGTCPVCLMDLVALGIVYYVCPMDCEKGKVYKEQQQCSVCKMDLVEQSMAHADHNPKHGGQFYMAPDRWHHVEGVLPAPREFQLYFYNNFTKPLDAEYFVDNTEAEAMVFGAKDGKDIHKLQLSLREDGTSMQAEMPNALSFPIHVKVRILFPGRSDRDLFDFFFENVSESQGN